MGGEPGTRERIDHLDAARGCAILSMIFVNFVAQYDAIPAWTKHAPGQGFTYVDAIAPAFVFFMGISGALSFRRRREAGGPRGVALHALRRYGVLFLFGTIGTVILYAVSGDPEWNIFQTLAVAGLFSFPFLFLKPPMLRIAASLALMALYQFALAFFLSGALFSREPALLFLPSCAQSLAMATLFLFGSGLAEWIRGGRTAAAAGITGVFALCAGFGLWYPIPPDRAMGSVTYLLLGLGSAASCLFLFWAVERILGWKRVPVFSTLGRNPLLIFMIAAVLTKVLNVLLAESTGAPAVLAVAALLEAFCLSAAVLLDRRGIHVRL